MIPFAIPWRLVGAIVGLALLVAGAWWVQHTIRGQDREIATLQADGAVKDAALQGAVDALDEVNQQHARDMAAVVADAAQARAQTHSDDQIIKEVHDVANPVRSTAECPADPAYDLELDRLQQRAAAGSGTGAPGGAGNGGGAAAGSH